MKVREYANVYANNLYASQSLIKSLKVFSGTKMSTSSSIQDQNDNNNCKKCNESM